MQSHTFDHYCRMCLRTDGSGWHTHISLEMYSQQQQPAMNTGERGDLSLHVRAEVGPLTGILVWRTASNHSTCNPDGWLRIVVVISMHGSVFFFSFPSELKHEGLPAPERVGQRRLEGGLANGRWHSGVQGCQISWEKVKKFALFI